MDFETSELKLTTGLIGRFDVVASFSVDSISEGGPLLLTIRMDHSNGTSVCGEYFSETQMLELYFHLKANLSKRHSNIL